MPRNPLVRSDVNLTVHGVTHIAQFLGGINGDQLKLWGGGEVDKL